MRQFKGLVGLALVLVGCSVDFSGKQEAPSAPAPPWRDGGPMLDPDGSQDGPALDGGADAHVSMPMPDAGKDAAPALRSCGSLPHGGEEQRERYPQAEVSHYADCVPELQVRRCHDGTLSTWSGSAQATSCQVALFGRCNEDVACAEGECVTSKTFPYLEKDCLATDGATCGDERQCVARCIAGVCAAPSSAGGTCDTSGDCSFLACLGASDVASCEDAICVCPVGAFCSDNAQCQGTCVRGRCVKFDETCDPGDADDCSSFAACVGGHCLRPDGAPCTGDAQCENVCRSGQCAPPPRAFGESCEQHSDCEAGLACALGRPQPDCRRAAGEACQNGPQCASFTCLCGGDDAGTCACAED